MGDSEMNDETGGVEGSMNPTSPSPNSPSPAPSGTPTPRTPVPGQLTTPNANAFQWGDPYYSYQRSPYPPALYSQPPQAPHHFQGAYAQAPQPQASYPQALQPPAPHTHVPYGQSSHQPPYLPAPQPPAAHPSASYPSYPPPNWQYGTWAAQTGLVQAPGNDSVASRRSSTTTNASTRTTQSAAPGTSSKEPRSKRKRTEQDGSGKGKDREIQALNPAHPSHLPDLAVLDRVQLQYNDIKAQLDRISQTFQSNPHAQASQGNPHAPGGGANSPSTVDIFIKQLLDGIKETHELIRATGTLQGKTGKRPAKRQRADEEGDDAGACDGDDEREDAKGDGDGDGDDEDGDSAGMDVDPVLTVPGREVRKKPVYRGKGVNVVANEVRRIFNAKFKGHQCSPEATTNPEIDNMVLDLTKKPGSRWNKAMKTLFVNAVIAMNVPEIVEHAPSRARLERLFVSNFRRHRERMQWSQLNAQQKEAKRRAHRRRERKRTLFYCRMEAADRYKETRRHVPMVAAYGITGMSTDESDHENGTGMPMYNIVPKPWRHPAAAGCLHILDALHRDFRFRPIRRAGPGAQPRSRLHPPSIASSSSPPVTGLPTSLYNPEWLSTQTPLSLQDLNAFPGREYDWSHEASIIDLSFQNHGKLDAVFGYT